MMMMIVMTRIVPGFEFSDLPGIVTGMVLSSQVFDEHNLVQVASPSTVNLNVTPPPSRSD